MAKYKYPGASGKESFSDNLVGRQITDGSSLMTNTSFNVDKTVPEKITKNFNTSEFSDFITIDDINQKIKNSVEDDKVKFRNKRVNEVSLFGSLSKRLLVSINDVILNYPAGLLVNSDSISSSNVNTGFDITYNLFLNETTLKIDKSNIMNPFGIDFKNSGEGIRFMNNSFTQYVVNYQDTLFNVIDYSNDERKNIITIKLKGKLTENLTITDKFLIRPNDLLVNTFFNGLDDIGGELLNRKSDVIYTSTFKVPTDDNEGNTIFVDQKFTWPLNDDGYNIVIEGYQFDAYIEDLKGISELIDNYKSNLFVRFMTAPQLYEFDTENKKMEMVMDFYGQSFDDTRKFIDNIAFMRNVSYDKINNVPDLFLKNLANLLGLETLEYIMPDKLKDYLYSTDPITNDSTDTENETEFYRRIIINLAYLFKSKGTRKPIEFFLKFIGAPKELIRFNEKIYRVKGQPTLKNLEERIYNVISGIETDFEIRFDTTTNKYVTEKVKYNLDYKRDGYPVKIGSNLPQKGFSDTMYPQKGAGWFKNTLKHTSEMIIDEDESTLTGNIKNIVLKNKDFSFGEEYFDIYRNLPGLDDGFDIVSENINNKIFTENDGLIINRKNIEIFLSSSDLITSDVYSKSNKLKKSFGILTEQSEVSFVEFLNNTLNKLIKNSHIIKNERKYLDLDSVLKEYMESTDFVPYEILKINDFVENIGHNWTKVIEQFVPSTTQWVGGNLYSNNFLRRDKFHYKKRCDYNEVKLNYVFDFNSLIREKIGDQLIKRENFRGLNEVQGIALFCEFTIGGKTYSSNGNVYDSLGNVINSDNSNIDMLVLSGINNTPDNIKMMNNYFQNYCGFPLTGLPLICEFSDLLNIDNDIILYRWISLVLNHLNYLKTKYFPDLVTLSSTDVNGNYVLSVITNNCDDLEIGLGLGIDIINQKYRNSLDLVINDHCGLNQYTTYSVGSEENCDVSSDVFFKLVKNSLPIGDDFKVNSLPVFIYGDDNSGVLNPVKFKENGQCDFKMEKFGEFEKTKFVVFDNSNSILNVEIDGLDIQYVNSNEYRIRPKVEYRQTYDQGYRFDETVTLSGGVTKKVNQLSVGDIVRNVKIKPPTQYTYTDLTNGLENNNLSFLYEYEDLEIKSIENLGSIKTSKITVKSIHSFNTLIELLPSMKILCYYRDNINEKFKIGFKYPDEINKLKEVDVSECCSDVIKTEIYGDYVIGANGELLAVIDKEVEQCDPKLYYSLNFKDYVGETNLCVGDDNIVLKKSSFESHLDYDMNVTYKITDVCCPEGLEPTIRISTGSTCDLSGDVVNTCL